MASSCYEIRPSCCAPHDFAILRCRPLVIMWPCGRMDIDGDGVETYVNGTIMWTGVTSCAHLKGMKLNKAFGCETPLHACKSVAKASCYGRRA